MVKSTFLSEQKLPLVVCPDKNNHGEATPESLLAWASNNKTWISDQLLTYGALLFRGFFVRDPAEFEKVVALVGGPPLSYAGGTLKRPRESGKIYNVSHVPNYFKIQLHQEMSYMRSFPGKLFFLCITPAQSGGETILADAREVLRRIDPAVKQRMIDRGVMYIRNLRPKSPLLHSLLWSLNLEFLRDWSETFETEDRHEVETFCRSQHIQVRWKGSGWLWLRNVLPATRIHPRTGEKVWFNQAHAFHFNRRMGVLYRLVRLYRRNPEDFPVHCFYGDGSPIPAEDIFHIQDVMDRSSYYHKWEAGDLLLVDNILVCHGRNPFKGHRKILVAMTEPVVLSTS